MSPSLFASESTTSLPLCSTFFWISIPRFAKKPFWIPRSSGRAFAMFSVRRLIVASVLSDELEAEPPKSSVAARAARSVATNSLLLILSFLSVRFSYRNRQLPLDQPVDVPAQVQELGQLFRCDLIARTTKVDPDDLLYFRGRMREHDHAVGEVHRLVDVVGDEQDRDAVLLAHAEHEVLELRPRLRVDRRERLVHEQDRGLVRECTRNRDALLHAARELPRVVVDEACQPD